MRLARWALAAALGFGLMLAGYSGRPRPDPRYPWAYGLILVGPVDTVQTPPPGRARAVRLRLLPGDARSEAILTALGPEAPGGALSLPLQLRPHLILLAMPEGRIGPESLSSGRLPLPGQGEVVAGARAREQRALRVGTQTLKVVGTLRPDLALFEESYLLPPSEAAEPLFPGDSSSVLPATLVELTPGQFFSSGVMKKIDAKYRGPAFAKFVPALRLGRRSFYIYLAGQWIFLVAGSGFLIALFDFASRRLRRPWLAAPLREMSARRRWLAAVYLIYFTLVILGSVLIYELPDVQTALMASVRAQIGAPSGVMSAAGRAYGSGSIPRAAVVTFLINFLLGSLAVITIPSMIVPGAGCLLAIVRATLWGILLAPSFVATARGMLLHSGTMLLEGEGYILAAFFALMIPVHLLQRSLGGTALQRFGRVLLLNVQASVWVALVLAVAAVYEATELILMAG